LNLRVDAPPSRARIIIYCIAYQEMTATASRPTKQCKADIGHNQSD
jgi:hypothetical protein